MKSENIELYGRQTAEMYARYMSMWAAVKTPRQAVEFILTLWYK